MASERRSWASEPPAAGGLPRAQVTGLLLCGGRSRRMGSDKALADLHGRPLMEYALRALESVAGQVLLASGGSARYGDLGRAVVLDEFADAGPLAGLLAGLEASGTEWVAVLACDMPRADGGVLSALLQRAAAGGLDACLLELERGTQPLCAVYHRRCAPAVRRALERGERRMVAFHAESLDGRPLRIGTLRPADLPAALRASGVAAAENVNTPSELESARAAPRRSGAP